MARVILEPGRTYQEFSLLPEFTPKNVQIKTVSLDNNFLGIPLRIPMLSAAMTSVTGYDMAWALGKEGGMAVLPVRMPTEEQASIIERIKHHETGFVERPYTINSECTIDQVLAEVDKTGHTKIPVTDRNNVLQGMFVHQHYIDLGISTQEKVTEAMIPFDGSQEIANIKRPEITIDDAKKFLEETKKEYMIVLDELDRVVKLSFKKDFEEMRIAAAISTHPGWHDKAGKIIEAGADAVFVDTSDAYNEFVGKTITDFKEEFPHVPLVTGNVITYEAALYHIAKGADAVKIGMSSGSICTTRREKAVGRAPMTALMEACRARDNFYKMEGKYVPIVIDGGINSAADMVIALTHADMAMMGGYFNKFWEAAGKKLDEEKRTTTLEEKAAYVESYGEGSAYAQNLERYGHSQFKTFFPEGEYGTVPYKGRLKPNVKKDVRKIQAAMVNVGVDNLRDYRNKAVIELMSPHAANIVGDTHNMQVKRNG